MNRKHIISVADAKDELRELGYRLHVRSNGQMTYIEATVRRLARKESQNSPERKGETIHVSTRPSPEEIAEDADLYAWLDRNAIADGAKIAVFA